MVVALRPFLAFFCLVGRTSKNHLSIAKLTTIRRLLTPFYVLWCCVSNVYVSRGLNGVTNCQKIGATVSHMVNNCIFDLQLSIKITQKAYFRSCKYVLLGGLNGARLVNV